MNRVHMRNCSCPLKVRTKLFRISSPPMRVCQDSDIGGGGIWIGGLYKGFGWPRMHGSHARGEDLLYVVPYAPKL